MTSRLEEAEHKAQSLQTGTGLVGLHRTGKCFNQLRENGNFVTEYNLLLKAQKTQF